MQKHIRKAIAISFAIFSTIAQAENSTSFVKNPLNETVELEINSWEELKLLSYLEKYSIKKEINYSTESLRDELPNKPQQEYEMKNLSQYISSQYKKEHDEAKKIVNASFIEAIKHNLDPMLILSIAGIESTYKKHAKSHMGAVGLTQVIPKYHRAKISDLKKDNLDLWSVTGNIRVGVQILQEYISLSKGNIQKALQMYNGSTKDKENRYSKKVFKKMDRLKLVSTSL